MGGRLAVVCGLALAAAGCGDNVLAPPPAVASGTRLKLVWNEYADGTRQLRPDELFDAQRGEECRIEIRDDGVYRCVPWTAGVPVPDSQMAVVVPREVALTGRVSERVFTSDDGFYLPASHVDTELDTSCLIRSISPEAVVCAPDVFAAVFYHDPDCTDAAYGEFEKVRPPPAITTGPSCAPRVYAVGGPTAVRPRYHRDPTGACVDDATPFSRFRDLEPRDPPTFARMRVPSPGRRLEPVVALVGGREVLADFFDTVVGEECMRMSLPVSPGEIACAPRNAAIRVNGHFLDAACTTGGPVAFVQRGDARIVCTSADVPRFVRSFIGPTAFYRLGPPTTAYQFIDGACRQLADPAIDVHELGEPVPNDTWLHASEVHDP